MNMMPRDWPLLDTRRPILPVPSRLRLISAGIVVAAHGALALALVWSRVIVTSPTPPPQPITVDILSAAPRPAEPVIGVKTATPDVPAAVMPLFTFAQPAERAITVSPPPGAARSETGTETTSRQAYFERLLAYLDSRKRYPAQARRLHIEGVVLLSFRLDRAGRVLAYEVKTSSGRPVLDEEARALLARAQPLPPLPSDWRESELTIVVPVEFRLR